MDQVLVLAAAMGAEAAEQLNRLEQIGFADAVASDHQQPWGIDLQLQRPVVAEGLQFQLEKPNWSWCGVWLRYLDWSAL